MRELSYPTPRPFRGLARFYSLPPLGNVLLLLAYWAMILTMLWSNVLLSPDSPLYGYRWEKPAYRAAWITVSQLPLVYALSSKINVISAMSGISYERLNWLHRWVAVTMWMTAIVHWSFFYTGWDIANFVKYTIELMPMTRWGFATWGVLGWIILSSFGLFRAFAHELWVLQHVASAGLLLWLVYKHVPSYAEYNIWLAIGFIAIDRVGRLALGVYYNVHLRRKSPSHKLVGFEAQAFSLPDGYICLRIPDAGFTWRPGQHVYVSLPRCGPLQAHPFTIAGGTDLEFFIKRHGGFTRQLGCQIDADTTSFHALVSAPLGNPPLTAIARANSLVFIATSTGASFTAPLLEYAVQHAAFARRVSFFWIVRHASQAAWLEARLARAAAAFAAAGVDVSVTIYVTGGPEGLPELLAKTETVSATCSSSLSGSGSGSGDAAKASAAAAETELPDKEARAVATQELSGKETQGINRKTGRPACLQGLVRPTVEAAEGETLVVACGSASLVAGARNAVAGLSDERAAHKGTGAQGIGLFTERYAW